ncbi:uncharacterized protein BXZ73DRAFT_108527 [Epithele typhae]|uniref:uncharacterized protein n=1 Tax=Epithele typhae TaxID=378194 RepID=UPI002007F791|nr:uncharacterized protein BXZ73DRAFT_108527 [Epithele typhae]KAH9910760.1 hypothetical protein BXZ73DRAFT_108527 [Epithele typhae]
MSVAGDFPDLAPTQDGRAFVAADDPVFGLLLGRLGIVVDVLVGVDCSPIAVVGLRVGGGSCNSNVVCC